MKTLLSVALACVLPLSLMACSVETGDSVMDETAELQSASPASFETFVGEDGKTYFHLTAGNGQVILRSQAYASARDAATGINSVLANGVDADNFSVETASNGETYFNLVAQNNRVVATSETYSSTTNTNRAIKSVVSSIQKVVSALPSTATRSVRFETQTGDDRKVYFRLRAANGEIVLGSQGYTSRSSALDGILSVRVNGLNIDNFEVFEAADGQTTFNLKAGNGQIIARGETYASRSNAERAVARIVELVGAVPAVTEH